MYNILFKNKRFVQQVLSVKHTGHSSKVPKLDLTIQLYFGNQVTFDSLPTNSGVIADF